MKAERVRREADAGGSGLQQVPAARYCQRVLLEALPGVGASPENAAAAASTAISPQAATAASRCDSSLPECEGEARDWACLVRCLLTVKRLRAENEICGLKLSLAANREFDDVLIHIKNKLLRSVCISAISL